MGKDRGATMAGVRTFAGSLALIVMMDVYDRRDRHVVIHRRGRLVHMTRRVDRASGDWLPQDQCKNY